MKKIYDHKSENLVLAYSNFMTEELSKILSQESIDYDKFSKECSEKWQIMPLHEKINYKSVVNETKVEITPKYMSKENNESSKSQKNVGSLSIKQKIRRRRKKIGAPKRPMTSYFYYTLDFRNEFRKEHPEWNLSQISAELARTWETCANKEHYINLGKLDRERYFKECKQFKAGYIFDDKSGKVINNLSSENSGNISIDTLPNDSSMLSYDTAAFEEDKNTEFLVA